MIAIHEGFQGVGDILTTFMNRFTYSFKSPVTASYLGGVCYLNKPNKFSRFVNLFLLPDFWLGQIVLR